MTVARWRGEHGRYRILIERTKLTTEAFEFTGNREHEFEPFVGRTVQIAGILKKAETGAVGTSGTGTEKPTGGFTHWDRIFGSSR